MKYKRKHLWNFLRTAIAVLCIYYLVLIFRKYSAVVSNRKCTLQKNENISSRFLLKNKVLHDERLSCPGGGFEIHDNYCAISYWAASGRKKPGDEKVTICTQGTPEFLHHVMIQCERWQGPISVAVYCPDDESFVDVAKVIINLRYCSSCVEHWVDWHLFYEKMLTKPPSNFKEALRNQSTIYCNFSETSKSVASEKKRKGIYPINVGRNLARLMSDTNFLLSIDIELYPSNNVRVRFEKMLWNQQYMPQSQRKEVWVLPVFEIKSKNEPPRTKTELKIMYTKKTAISFHQYRCNSCHKIPNLTQWINHTSNIIDITHVSEIKPFQIFSTVKRNRKFKLQFWEPFFIGTKTDPEFDYRLSWEGKLNKMQMAYEMCLLDYDFHILDEAFLVHSPGINIFNPKKEKFRMVYVKQNARVMKLIKKDLLKIYGNRSVC